MDISSLLSPLSALIRSLFRKDQKEMLCYNSLIPLEKLIEQIPKQTLRTHIFHYIKQDLDFFQKSEIQRAISMIRSYLLETIPAHSSKCKWISFQRKTAIRLLKERLPNEWLWVLGFYLQRSLDDEFIQAVREFRLLENISSLNEILPNEMGLMNEAQFEHFSEQDIDSKIMLEHVVFEQQRLQIQQQFLPKE